jgi:hypothetical protein
MSSGRKMIARIPCTPETHNRLRDFCSGLSLNYDEAINFVLSELSENGEAEMLAGFRLREKAQAWKASQEKVKQEK